MRSIMIPSHRKPAIIIRNHHRLANSPDNHHANPLDNNDHNKAVPHRNIGQTAQSIFRNVSTLIAYFHYNIQRLINSPPRTLAYPPPVCGNDVQENMKIQSHV